MLAVALALASSLCWGLSDFVGGLQSRRQALLAVLWISQGSALLVLLAAAAAGAPTAHDGAATAWAAGAGLLGLCGLAAFYRALSIGTMSIVAPLSATGTAIPVLVGLASGERPSVLQAAGMALAGVRRRAGRARGAGATTPRRAARAAARSCSRWWPRSASGRSSPGSTARSRRPTSPGCCSMARLPDVAILTLARARAASAAAAASRRALAALLVVGVFDLLANLFFALATGRGLLSVVGVLGSLYPAVTVVLARVLLHERPTRVQDVGVAVTLAGVLAIAAAEGPLVRSARGRPGRPAQAAQPGGGDHGVVRRAASTRPSSTSRCRRSARTSAAGSPASSGCRTPTC